MSRYEGRQAVLATKHGKERVIGPALAATAGLRVIVAPEIDTDQLGTFTGEVERPGPAFDVAVAKARLGMERSGLRIGIASEGSFGPHLAAPFISAGLELIVCVDDELGITVHEELLTEVTNAAHLDVRPDDPLDPWLARVGFPEHALIVQPRDGQGRAVKGIADRSELRRQIRDAAGASGDGMARIETDLRADRNPTRMRAIGEVAERLGRRLAATCPSCASPGFGVEELIPGLPCGACAWPTDRTLAVRRSCPHCPYERDEPRPDGRTTADPGTCARCNP